MNKTLLAPRRAVRGFTLIELLVVIAIIAILAAILFPVFAQAREKARQASCLSNQKQMGLAIMQYKQDYDETFPQAYWYNDDNSGNPPSYYHQWSGTVQPYIKSIGIFVCPSDATGGLAPTNWSTTTNNQGFGVPQDPVTGLPQGGGGAIQDDQAPRVSYLANANIMPRKRRSIDPALAVGDSMVDESANEILIAEMTQYPACINDASIASGAAYKTHRSTNGFSKVKSGQGGTGKWAGEVDLDYYLDATRSAPAVVYALDYNQISTIFDSCKTAGAGSLPHIAYTNPLRHNGGSNYTFADGHAKWYKLQQTLDAKNYLWGKKLHPSSFNQPILNPATDLPVQ